ncbi:MAG: alpha-galactosidase [Parabacteroides gordonii]|nr:alpha-galactosidase [Parabacteroides gordonii]
MSIDITVNGWKMNELHIDVADTSVWSFQPTSTSRRMDWILEVKPGYYKKNFLGMNDSDYGGGIPMIDLWRRDGGIVTGLTEKTLKMISMPVQWLTHDNHASIALTYESKEGREILAAGDTLRTYNSFIGIHTGDFYEPLDRFSRYMETQGIVFPKPEPEAYEAVWCAWGYERTFTIEEIIGTLPKVKELGFKWVDVDDGFQIAEGDWETNSRFPGGDKDMRRITDAIHQYGMKAKLWWAPLAADPGTKVLQENPGIKLKTQWGSPQYITWWDSYYLSPINPITEKYTNNLLERFIVTWNFDGLKLDGQHMNCCLPDYNRTSKLEYPEQSSELMPTYFQNIYEKARTYKPNAVVQFCPCGCAINYFMIPFMNQAVSSDPTSSWQIRHKAKTYRAISDKLAYYADHVELSDNGDDFGTQIGIGGVIGSKFTYPKDNPNVRKSYVLTPEKEKLYKKWVSIYNDKMISTGNYINLYDIAYDKPETHVINKDGKMYYAFYADQWNGEPIELRGLEKRKYTVCEYTSDEKKTYEIDGENPVITPYFTRNYLIEVY